MKRRNMVTLSKTTLADLNERDTAITRLSTLLSTLNSLEQNIPLCEETSEVYIDTLVDIIALDTSA